MEGVRSAGFEDGTISLVASTTSVSENGKSDFSVPELVRSRPSDLVLSVKDCSLDDGDSVGRCPVVTGHLSVELADGSVEGNIPELLVHVVVSSSGLIPQDNAECFDMIRLSLEDLVNC